jgi:hypothetical protein
VQNVLAWAFELFKNLVAKGKMDRAFASSLARYGIWRHREGRIFGTPRNTVDAMAEGSRACGRSNVKHYGYDTGSSMLDARNPVDEIVQFQIDFSDWYGNHSVRDQWIISDLAMSVTPKKIGAKYAISQARICQLRKWFYKSWTNFIDPPEAGMLVPA